MYINHSKACWVYYSIILISISVINWLKRYINCDVNLSTSVYLESTFLCFTRQLCDFASRKFRDYISIVYPRFFQILILIILVMYTQSFVTALGRADSFDNYLQNNWHQRLQKRNIPMCCCYCFNYVNQLPNLCKFCRNFICTYKLWYYPFPKNLKIVQNQEQYVSLNFCLSGATISSYVL